MSEPWRGLHNPERHNPMTNYAECRRMDGGCGIPCQPDCLCFCCREKEHQIEVEALRGQTEAMMRIIERDTAAIQRVREVCERQRCYGEYGQDAEVVAAVPIHVLLAALDGGDDE